MISTPGCSPSQLLNDSAERSSSKSTTTCFPRLTKMVPSLCPLRLAMGFHMSHFLLHPLFKSEPAQSVPRPGPPVVRSRRRRNGRLPHSLACKRSGALGCQSPESTIVRPLHSLYDREHGHQPTARGHFPRRLGQDPNERSAACLWLAPDVAVAGKTGGRPGREIGKELQQLLQTTLI
jgi:hypothetical protein